MGGTRSDPGRVPDRVERPVAFQPCADRVVKHWVELRTVRAHPGTDGYVMFTPAGAALAFAARRVHVHAAHDFPGVGAWPRVGEPAALGEGLPAAVEAPQLFRPPPLSCPAP